MTITDANVTQISAVSACVKVISEDLAKLPVTVYEEKNGFKSPAKFHHVHKLLHLKPNDEMSAFSFRRFLFRSALLRGNGFAYIQRDGSGRPIALWPMLPDYVALARRKSDNRLVYDYRVGGTVYSFDARDVLHIKGDSDDGIVGNSPIKQFALTFGESMAMAEFGAKFFENGAIMSVVVEVPPTMADAEKEEKDRFEDQFNGKHAGVANAFRTVFIDAGGKVTPISVTNDQSKILELRKFSRSEIAGIFRVAPNKIGDYERSTFSNVEAQNTEHANDALQSWAEQFEQECRLKLFSESEQDRFYVKHSFDALLRANSKERAEAIEIRLRSGQLTPNEARALDDLPPVEGGDVSLVMSNMTTLQALKKQTDEPASAS